MLHMETGNGTVVLQVKAEWTTNDIIHWSWVFSWRRFNHFGAKMRMTGRTGVGSLRADWTKLCPVSSQCFILPKLYLFSLYVNKLVVCVKLWQTRICPFVHGFVSIAWQWLLAVAHAAVNYMVAFSSFFLSLLARAILCNTVPMVFSGIAPFAMSGYPSAISIEAAWRTEDGRKAQFMCVFNVEH